MNRRRLREARVVLESFGSFLKSPPVGSNTSGTRSVRTDNYGKEKLFMRFEVREYAKSIKRERKRERVRVIKTEREGERSTERESACV